MSRGNNRNLVGGMNEGMEEQVDEKEVRKVGVFGWILQLFDLYCHVRGQL